MAILTLSKRPFRLSPTHDRLLRGSMAIPYGLYQLHVATCDQLTRLHYRPGSFKFVQKRLKALCDHDYVQADAMPTRRFKSPYYYTLGAKGIRYLAEVGLDVSDAYRASKEVDKSWLFLEHTLELNDVLISAALLHEQIAGVTLRTVVHERTLKRKPYKTVWKGQPLALIPDAFIVFQLHGQRRPWLLEHDRGTEEQHYFRRRIRAHIALYKEDHVPVAFTTFVGEQRREQMRAWTRAELDSSAEPRTVGIAFRFASLTQPLDPHATWTGQQWYTPYDDPPQALLTA